MQVALYKQGKRGMFRLGPPVGDLDNVDLVFACLVGLYVRDRSLLVDLAVIVAVIAWVQVTRYLLAKLFWKQVREGTGDPPATVMLKEYRQVRAFATKRNDDKTHWRIYAPRFSPKKR